LKPSALASKASPYCRRFDRGVSSYLFAVSLQPQPSLI
jgi:hypothetical protein